MGGAGGAALGGGRARVDARYRGGGRAARVDDGGGTALNAGLKLVWFVPAEALEATRDAVFRAGAGRIGEYERCSWYAQGTGTFLAGEGSDPAIGEVGREEHVPELRVETVVPEERAADVVAALLAAHPYEEVAYDLYPLVSP